MKLGLQLWCWYKSHSLQWISKTWPIPKKIMASLVQCESDADCIFWLWGRNSLWISTLWPDSEQGILSEGDAKAERGNEGKETWFVEGKIMVAPSWQCSSTFLPSDSWFSHETWDDAHPPACVLSRPCTQQTSFPSSSCSLYWKDDDLTVLRRFKKIHWQSYALFQKRHSRNGAKTGRNAGSNVWKVEESTSKGTNPNSSKVSEKTIYFNCLESLKTDLIYTVHISSTSPYVY